MKTTLSSLPRGELTNRFSDIAIDIEHVLGKRNGEIAYEIAKAVQKETPTLSNALANSWKYGPTATGHVLGKGPSEFNDRTESGTIIPQKWRPIEPIEHKTYTKMHDYFFIWNNTPYLEYVNDGLVFGRRNDRGEQNRNFVQRGMRIGYDNAESKGYL